MYVLIKFWELGQKIETGRMANLYIGADGRDLYIFSDW
jgi:hypothetical protein